MKAVVPTQCPECGAELRLDASGRDWHCTECGNVVPSEYAPTVVGSGPRTSRERAAQEALQEAPATLGPGASSARETTPVSPREGDPAPPIVPGFSFPNYRVVRRIGRGGMGEVFEAEQQNPRRTVALKVLSLQSSADEALRARFLREGVAVARLQHPYIVPIYESGQTDAGVLFYSMEMITGDTVDQHVASHDLDLQALLRLFIKVCEGVQAAHQRGVIHRDLKPANIIVDGEGNPRILDFGLAKIVAEEAREHEVVTFSGAVFGTPAYMSPEQTVGKQEEVDTLSDIYSLGVILFRLLTGRFPYDISGPPLAVLERIRESEPIRLSTLLASIDRDLESVVLKAIAKEKPRRYQSAIELADDLRRYLANEPVEACFPSTAYRLRKLIARNRGVSMMALASCVALFCVLGISFFRITSERNRAVKAERTTLRALEQTEREKDRALKAQEAEAAQRRRAETELARATQAEAQASRDRDAAIAAKSLAEQENYYNTITLAEKRIAESDFDGAATLLSAAPSAFRHWEWGRLALLCMPEVQQIHKRQGLIRTICFTRDDQSLILAGTYGTEVWGVDGESNFGLPDPRVVQAASLSPDGTLFATCGTPGPSGSVKLSDMRDRAWGLGDLGAVSRVAAFSHDGTNLLVGTDCTLSVFDVASGVEQVHVERPATVNAAVFLPDGRRIAATTGTRLEVFDAATGRNLGSSQTSVDLRVLASSPACRQILVGGAGGEFGVWDVDAQTGPLKPPHWVNGSSAKHKGGVTDVQINHSGTRFAVGSAEGSVTIWDAKDLTHLMTLRFGDRVDTLAFSNDDRSIAVAGGRIAKIWDLGAYFGDEIKLSGHGARISALDFSPDGSLIASGGLDGKARLYRLPKMAPVAELKGAAKQGINAVRFSPDGNHLVTSDKGRTLLAHGGHGYAATGIIPILVVHPPPTERGSHRLQFATYNGKHAGWEHRWTASVWDTRSWVEEQQFSAEFRGDVTTDGTLAAAVCDPRTANVRDLRSGRELYSLTAPEGVFSSMAFSSDSRSIAVGIGDVQGGSVVRVLEAATGSRIAEVRAEQGFLVSLAFSPDSHYIAASLYGRTVRHATKVWELPNGREVLDDHSGQSMITVHSFSPDSRYLVVGSGPDSQAAMVADLPNGGVSKMLHGHRSQLLSIRFSGDGRRLFTGGSDGTVGVWDPRTGREILVLEGQEPALSLACSSVSGLAIGGGTRAVVLPALDWTRSIAQLRQERLHYWYRAGARRDAQAAHAVTEDGRLSVSRERVIDRPWGLIQAATFSRDGDQLLLAGTYGMQLVAMESGKQIAMRGSKHHHSVSLSPDGRLLAVGGRGASGIYSWEELERGETELQVFEGMQRDVGGLAFSPDGTVLAAGGVDGTVETWAVRTGRRIAVTDGLPKIGGVQFFGDNRRLVVSTPHGSRGNDLSILDATTGRVMQSIEVGNSQLFSMALTPDNRKIITGDSRGTVRIIDAVSGGGIRSVNAHTGVVHALAVSPDGQCFATGGADGFVTIRETATGRELARFNNGSDGVDALAYSRDGKALVAGGGHRAVVWRLRSEDAQAQP